MSWRDVSAQKELERLEDEFISSVSHELRTPLTSITGSLALLLGGVAGDMPAKATRLIDIAHKNSQRLTTLVNDLLDIDKMEAGHVAMKEERVDINVLVAQSVEQNRPYADKFGARLVLDVSPDAVFVNGDPDRLHQLMANLLSNAAKHSPQGGTVTVSVRREGPSVRVAVADQGPGIPEQFRSRIFQRFAQADASDRRAREGTGLGLAISRAIVERHGGKIGFETEQGVGTTFFFALPMLDAGAASDNATGFRVLVCEAGEQAALDIASVLRASGTQADIATSMSDALRLLRERHYDVLVLELILPDGNGLDLIRRVRDDARLRDIAVVVVSAVSGDRHREAGALNVLDWLDKTRLDHQHLIAAVEQAARSSERRKLRVLHVEDEKDLREVVAVALGGVAQVEAAGNLADARSLLASGLYDVVILDLALPDGSSAELLPLITEGGGVPPSVIIFSASTPDAEVMGKVHKALIKSQVTVEQLVEIVRQSRPVRDHSASLEP